VICGETVVKYNFTFKVLKKKFSTTSFSRFVIAKSGNESLEDIRGGLQATLAMRGWFCDKI
jgi:hypothetical protein